MSIRLSNAQVTRINEARNRLEDQRWQGRVATESFVEDILTIVLEEEKCLHLNAVQIQKEQQSLRDL